jgi:heme-degrading monooxygenase HmoA
MDGREPQPKSEPSKPVRILRVWRGATSAADAEPYVGYMSRTGFPGLRGTPGNLGVLGLVRVTGDRAEHVVMSLWESEEAIRRFAGDEIGRAVFYPDDDRFLVERDEHVDHFRVMFADGWEKR